VLLEDLKEAYELIKDQQKQIEQLQAQVIILLQGS